MNNKGTIMIVFFMLFFSITGLSAEEKSAQEKTHSGIVLSVETKGAYMYIKLKEDNKEVWLAALPINVAEGDKVEYAGGDVMEDFHSKSMNKTFDSIRFVTFIRVANKDSSVKKQAVPDDKYHKNIPKKQETVSIPKSGEIPKAENGKTVKEIFSEREQLKGKEVIVRARVIKVNKNILNKNWITLHDGTGLPPDDKLIATTTDNVNTGDIVTVKGIVKTDMKIGAGYNYKVLIEGAKLIK